jgi:hypothetical protein
VERDLAGTTLCTATYGTKGEGLETVTVLVQRTDGDPSVTEPSRDALKVAELPQLVKGARAIRYRLPKRDGVRLYDMVTIDVITENHYIVALEAESAKLRLCAPKQLERLAVLVAETSSAL